LTDANACQDRAMVRQPLLQVPDRSHHRRLTKVGEVKPDLVDLGPALSAGMLEGVVDVCKGLIDFVVEVTGNLTGRWVPAAWDGCQRGLLGVEFEREMYLGRRVRWRSLCGRLGCTRALRAWLRRSRGRSSIGGEP
jgi:hypothetical protein